MKQTEQQDFDLKLNSPAFQADVVFILSPLVAATVMKIWFFKPFCSDTLILKIE